MVNDHDDQPARATERGIPCAAHQSRNSPTALNVVSPDAAEFFFGRAAHPRIAHTVGSLPELYELLEHLPAEVTSPVTLDLMGHSTRLHHLLRLGGTPIDMLNPEVARFFRRLADARLLPRRSISAVRLLGCETAVSEAGRRTLRMLSQTLGLPVLGTLRPLLRSHTNAAGFNPLFSHVLAEASALHQGPRAGQRT